jgi:TRAP-type C4-dicarboxylate transport system permease large subunit
VGTVLNVVSSVARVRMEEVIKGVTPYVVAYTLLVALMVIFPQIVLVPLDWFY